VYEPGGNRIEVFSGGYLIFTPDFEPVTWTQEERAKGQAWGLQLPETFHTYGTPVVNPGAETKDVPVFGSSS
jgi:catechol 2,3-dioxygenase